LQFAGLPLNFLGNNPNASANYTTTGYFSKLSFSEAKRYCNAKSISALTTDKDGFFYLEDNYDFDKNAAYTHFIENESVEGLSYSTERFPTV
jgi:phosphoserine aminotransferase